MRSLLKKKTTRARPAQANKKGEKDIENHLRQDPFERRHRRRLPRRDPPFHHPRPGRHPAEGRRFQPDPHRLRHGTGHRHHHRSQRPRGRRHRPERQAAQRHGPADARRPDQHFGGRQRKNNDPGRCCPVRDPEHARGRLPPAAQHRRRGHPDHQDRDVPRNDRAYPLRGQPGRKTPRPHRRAVRDRARPPDGGGPGRFPAGHRGPERQSQ